MVLGEEGKIVLKAVNSTKETVLCPRVEVADSFLRRLIGFMFKRNIPFGSGLLFLRCNAIHTFFLLAPLDVIFLDEEGKVVKTIEGLRPWRVVLPVRGARHTLETARGSIRRSRTKVGDRIVFLGPIDLSRGDG